LTLHDKYTGSLIVAAQKYQKMLFSLRAGVGKYNWLSKNQTKVKMKTKVNGKSLA